MKLYLVLLLILQITVWKNCIAQDYPVDYFTAQTELEQNAIVHGLEYLKINYSDILNKANLQLKKHRTKFKEELEATWPKKNGTVVTIEPDPPIKNVEEVSEILLVLPNLN